MGTTAITPNGAFPYNIPPLSNISPFTYRDGVTYLELLYDLRDYISSITPQIDGKLADVVAQFNAGSQAWSARFDAFMANFQNEIQTLNESAVAGMIPAGAVHDALITVISGEIANATSENHTYTDTAVSNAMTTLRGETGTVADDVAALKTKTDTTNTAVAGKLSTTLRGAVNGVASLDAGAKVPASQLPPASGRGTLLARPAANIVPAGYRYTAYDVMETSMSDGTDWYVVNHGGVFATVKNGAKFDTANYGPVSGGADVPGMALTFVGGTQPVKITLVADLANTYGNALTTAGVMVNGSFIDLFLNDWTGTVTEKWSSRSKTTLFTPTPGTVYTVKVQLWTAFNQGGHALMDGGANASMLMVEGA